MILTKKYPYPENLSKALMCPVEDVELIIANANLNDLEKKFLMCRAKEQMTQVAASSECGVGRTNGSSMDRRIERKLIRAAQQYKDRPVSNIHIALCFDLPVNERELEELKTISTNGVVSGSNFPSWLVQKINKYSKTPISISNMTSYDYKKLANSVANIR